MSAAIRVLVVEDDKSLRQACEAGLRQQGFDVVTATDGEQGLRLARETPHADLILVDLLMPKLPGIAFLRAIKAQPATAAIPVVILSNSSREDDKQQALECGAAGYFVKANLSLRDLAAEVDRLVHDAQAGGLGRRRQTPGAREPP